MKTYTLTPSVLAGLLRLICIQQLWRTVEHLAPQHPDLAKAFDIPKTDAQVFSPAKYMGRLQKLGLLPIESLVLQEASITLKEFGGGRRTILCDEGKISLLSSQVELRIGETYSLFDLMNYAIIAATPLVTDRAIEMAKRVSTERPLVQFTEEEENLISLLTGGSVPDGRRVNESTPFTHMANFYAEDYASLMDVRLQILALLEKVREKMLEIESKHSACKAVSKVLSTS